LRWLFAGFNWLFDKLAAGYGFLTARLVRVGLVSVLVYIGLIYFAYDLLRKTPTGLIPQLDRGYLIAAFQLPPGASLDRTDKALRRAADIILHRPGVLNSVVFAGFDGATFMNAPNTGVIFVALKPFEECSASRLCGFLKLCRSIWDRATSMTLISWGGRTR
jgi:multidrug efflux pump subunit AcrB